LLPLCRDDWRLDEMPASDIDELMKWFPDEASTRTWGGPDFRFPFNRHSFAEDIHWGRMATFTLRAPDGAFAAFGQVYERVGCINLARLAVNPTMRGRGVGTRLVEMLMMASAEMFNCDRYSLFVYQDNTPAYKCYTALGFELSEYPENALLADVCDYLTRPVTEREKNNAP
jgi:ribosomal protein S18 acetylase RimI-like enzyme